MIEIGRKYIVHVSGIGLATVLTIYAFSCQPLLPSQITQIARQHVDPACVVLSYNVEAPELPGTTTTTNSMPFAVMNSGTSIGTTTTL